MNKNKDFEYIFSKQSGKNIVKSIISQDDPGKMLAYLKSYNIIDKTHYLYYYKNCPFCITKKEPKHKDAHLKGMFIKTKQQLKLGKALSDSDSSEDEDLSIDDVSYYSHLSETDLYERTNLKLNLESFSDNLIETIRRHPFDESIFCVVPDEVRNLIVEIFLENFKYVNSNISPLSDPTITIQEYYFKEHQKRKKQDKKYALKPYTTNVKVNESLSTEVKITNEKSIEDLRNLIHDNALDLIKSGVDVANYKIDNSDNINIDSLCNKIGIAALFTEGFINSNEFKLIDQKFNSKPLKYYKAYFKLFNFVKEIEGFKIKKENSKCFPKEVLYDKYISIENRERVKELEQMKEYEKYLIK